MLSNLAADRARIADLDVQISALEKSLLILKKERQSAQARLDAYIYPALKLPNEIVSHIFVGFLPDYPLCPPLFGALSPISLGHICRKWRAIALSTPMLWRAICFALSRKRTSQELELLLPCRLEAFEAWLGRSGSCPLSVELHEDVASKALARFVLAILPHLAHTEHLKLSCGVHPSESPLDIEYSLPLLRHLEFRCLNVAACSAPVTSFLKAPGLRSVILTSVFTSSQIALPWHQLTALVLENISSHTSAEILNQTPNLIHCRLLTLFGPSVPNINPLTRLESLEIVMGSLGRWRTSPVLDRLTAPALQSLKITIVDGFEQVVRALGLLISRSECSLGELHIFHNGWDIFDSESPTATADMYRAAFPSISVLLVDGE
ncbi:hypothetical protein B0H19DRAFT_1103617 [Mycena capillaripes]|nr:hypothetical protein B0H19DRAFT_1103617 [Mycena capillaripes]